MDPNVLSLPDDVLNIIALRSYSIFRLISCANKRRRSWANSQRWPAEYLTSDDVKKLTTEFVDDFAWDGYDSRGHALKTTDPAAKPDGFPASRSDLAVILTEHAKNKSFDGDLYLRALDAGRLEGENHDESVEEVILIHNTLKKLEISRSNRYGNSVDTYGHLNISIKLHPSVCKLHGLPDGSTAKIRIRSEPTYLSYY